MVTFLQLVTMVDLYTELGVQEPSLGQSKHSAGSLVMASAFGLLRTCSCYLEAMPLQQPKVCVSILVLSCNFPYLEGTSSLDFFKYYQDEVGLKKFLLKDEERID